MCFVTSCICPSLANKRTRQWIKKSHIFSAAPARAVSIKHLFSQASNSAQPLPYQFRASSLSHAKLVAGQWNVLSTILKKFRRRKILFSPNSAQKKTPENLAFFSRQTLLKLDSGHWLNVAFKRNRCAILKDNRVILVTWPAARGQSWFYQNINRPSWNFSRAPHRYLNFVWVAR